MSDLNVILLIEHQLAKPLESCDFEVVMHPNSRCNYAMDSQKQVIGLNLQSCDYNDLALISELKNLKRLNLSLNQISKLTALKELSQLTQLNLQKNAITDISALKRLINLTSLNLQDNHISELRSLRGLTQLTLLNLQANQIRELKALKNLNRLTHLNLSANLISQLKELSSLNALIELNLASNQITDLEGLKTLLALNELDLRFNQISDLKPLSKLKNLTRLYLSSNKITELAPLAELTALTLLHLNANQISNLEALASLTNLTELDLRANKISQLDALEELTKLTSLHLENNEISDVNPLKKLTQLTLLNLRTNQISVIDGLKNLKNLTQLYLSTNQIKSLPHWIIDFDLKIKWNSGGDGISVSANPLKNPPPEIIRQGNKAIKNYFDSEEQQQQRFLYEAKICFIGDSGVGKTSLWNLLQGGTFNPQQPETDGINTADWQLNNTLLHLWDFSGNPIIQGIHNLFFSRRCLYVLVLDNRAQRNEEDWLRKIEYHAGDVPVLIVLNKCEQSESYDVDRRKLIKSYNSLQSGSFFSVSCAQGIGLNDFKQSLQVIVKKMVVKNPVTENWLQVRNVLQQQKQQPYFCFASYQQLCLQHGIKELEQQQHLAQLLHDVGGCFYFHKASLDEIYLLNVDWFIKSLYKLINTASIVNNQGFLLLKDLPTVLKPIADNDSHYSVEQYRDLVNLMRRLELCFLLDKTTLVFAHLLSNEEPEIIFEKKNSLRFRIYYPYLNTAIMPRLIVILHKEIVDNKCWYSGVLLKNDVFACHALVKVNYPEHIVTIQINGEKKRDYFSYLQQVLQNIDVY